MKRRELISKTGAVFIAAGTAGCLGGNPKPVTVDKMSMPKTECVVAESSAVFTAEQVEPPGSHDAAIKLTFPGKVISTKQSVTTNDSGDVIVEVVPKKWEMPEDCEGPSSHQATIFVSNNRDPSELSEFYVRIRKYSGAWEKFGPFTLTDIPA